MDRPFVREGGRGRRSAKVTDSRERESEWRARSFQSCFNWVNNLCRRNWEFERHFKTNLFRHYLSHRCKLLYEQIDMLSDLILN